MKRKGCFWLLGGALLLLLIIYAAGSWFFAGVLVDSPVQSLEDSRENAEFTSFTENGYVEPEDVTIQSGEVNLAGWYLENDGAVPCGVVLLHGYTSNRYGATQYIPFFWERGCDLLLYDARGHGASDDALHTYGYYEKEDAAAAVDWLAAESELSQEEIGVVGVSYGAATALQLIPLRPDLAFVLADSAYQDLYSIADYQAGEQFGGWARLFVPGAAVAAALRADMNPWQVSPRNAVVGGETPVLLIHALEDTFTPARHSEEIFEQSNQAFTDLHVTDWGAGHGRSILADEAGFWALVDAFLAEHAQAFGASG